MTPATRLALTVLMAAAAAGLTIAVAAWAIPSGSPATLIAPLVLLIAAALLFWHRR